MSRVARELTTEQIIGTEYALPHVMSPVRCLYAGVVGEPVSVDSRGTYLQLPLMASVWQKLYAISIHRRLAGWGGISGSQTFPQGYRALTARCSATLDELERPAQVEYFTPSTSEWVTDYVFSSPPVFLAYESSHGGPRKLTQNVGFETVAWLRDFLGCSQEKACRYARVPAPTFYMWRNRPQTVVRPATIAHGLRLRATLELASRNMGRVATIRALSSGNPSVLDALGGTEEQWEQAVAGIGALAEPVITKPARRSSSSDEYLARMNELDSETTSSPGEIVLGAQMMSDEEIAEAEAWGWGIQETH